MAERIVANSQRKSNQFSIDDVVQALEAKGCNPQPSGAGFKACCPAHDDHNPSLSVFPGDKGGVGIKCHSQGCTYKDILEALGLSSPPSNGRPPSAPRNGGRKAPVPCKLPTGPDITHYHYVAADGRPQLCVVRRDLSTGGKEVHQWTPAGSLNDDLWIPRGLKKGRLSSLFQLQGLVKTTGPAWVVEGEKCCMALQKHLGKGVAVVTWAGGSNRGAVLKTEWVPLKGRSVAILADADAVGRKCAQQVAGLLHELGVDDIKISLPEGGDGRDVADWIEAGTTDAEIDRLLKPWTPDEEEAGVQFTIPGGKTARGLELALGALGIEIRFDLRAMQEQFRRDVYDWKHVNDQAFDALRAEIAERCSYATKGKGLQPLSFGRDAFRSALNALMFYRNCDPFMEWLESLPSWDNTPRLDAVLSDLFEVPTNPLSIWAAQYAFVGAIQRTFEPGCRLDEVPVLVGPGRSGKSAFCREVLPPENQIDWFGDFLDLAEDARRCAESLDGVVICEIPEMVGASRADLRKLKAFLSRRNDKIRRAYARSTETCLRRSVFIATTDDSYSLPNDKAGNRRFVPVDLPGRGHVEPFMAAFRVQLWAEALNRYRDGVRANLPAQLFDNQAEAVEAHRRASEAVEQHCATFLHRHDGVTLAEMIQQTDFTEHQMRDAAALLGFRRERKRMDGKKLRLWFPPEPS